MENNNLAVASPIQLNGPGTMIDSSFCRAAVFNTKNVEMVTDLAFGKPKNYYKVVSVPAASWMLSKKIIETIGGFDPLFFHYGEDSNYCQRLKYHNETIAIVPNAYIYHDRFEKGNTALFNKIDILRMLFLEYADINHKPFIINKNTFKLHLHIIANLLKGLITFNGQLICNTWWTINQFYTHLGVIKRSRRNNVTKQSNWLAI